MSSPASNTIEELYIEQLKNLHSVEVSLIDALSEMANAATHPRIKADFAHHMEETRVHVERLEVILASHDEIGTGKTCGAMESIIRTGKELIHEKAPAAVIDAGLLVTAQLAENYEIAGYGCVQSYARVLGDAHAVTLLQKTLDEEARSSEQFCADSNELCDE
ncbi:ferritin-like domain-containing protein [Verrucomicrobia bacterium LW23]|nr:ferritin-like domain-containing protein [Verrucomicrobia bacterium LW23]